MAQPYPAASASGTSQTTASAGPSTEPISQQLRRLVSGSDKVSGVPTVRDTGAQGRPPAPSIFVNQETVVVRPLESTASPTIDTAAPVAFSHNSTPPLTVSEQHSSGQQKFAETSLSVSASSASNSIARRLSFFSRSSSSLSAQSETAAQGIDQPIHRKRTPSPTPSISRTSTSIGPLAAVSEEQDTIVTAAPRSPTQISLTVRKPVPLAVVTSAAPPVSARKLPVRFDDDATSLGDRNSTALYNGHAAEHISSGASTSKAPTVEPPSQQQQVIAALMTINDGSTSSSATPLKPQLPHQSQQHSPRYLLPVSSPTTPPNTHASSTGGGPSSTTMAHSGSGTRGSAKAAAMLGIAGFDDEHPRHPHYQAQQHQAFHSHSNSPTSPGGASYFSHASSNSNGESGQQHSTRSSTLKKARSLFSSSSNKGDGGKHSSTMPPLPSMFGGFNGINNVNPSNGSSSANKLHSMLSHSKSHGTLGGYANGETFPGSGSNRNVSAPYSATSSVMQGSYPKGMGSYGPMQVLSATQSVRSNGSSTSGRAKNKSGHSAYDSFYNAGFPMKDMPPTIDQLEAERHERRRRKESQTDSIVSSGIVDSRQFGGMPSFAQAMPQRNVASHAPSQGMTIDARPTRGGSTLPSTADDDVSCPICLESLSLRMAGEMPHVVPVCGHKLHADCFETAYGVTAKQALKNQEQRLLIGGSKKSQSLGICGICRAEMRVAEDQGAGKNKFAALAGQGGSSASSIPLDSHKMHSVSKKTMMRDDFDDDMTYGDSSSFGGRGRSASAGGAFVTRSANNSSNIPNGSLHNPEEDQDTVSPNQHLPAYMQHMALSGQSVFSGVAGSDLQVQPKVTVRAEHSTITRCSDPEERIHLTCMVTVEIPARAIGSDKARERAQTVGTISGSNMSRAHSSSLGTVSGHLANGQGGPRRQSNATSGEDFPTSPSVSAFSGGQPLHISGSSGGHSMEHSLSSSSNGFSNGLSPQTNLTSAFTTPGSTSAASFASGNEQHFAKINSSTVTLTQVSPAAEEEMAREAHGPFSEVYDELYTRMADWKGHQPANFGSLRMFDTLQVRKDKNVRDFIVYLFEEALLCVVDDRKKGAPLNSEDKLRLKGRVFVRHMRSVEDSSSADTGLSLTIRMEDDSLDSFVILYATRESLEVWRSQIQSLIDHNRPPVSSKSSDPASPSKETTSTRRDSLGSEETSQSALSSMSRHTKATTAASVHSSHQRKNQPTSQPDYALPPLPTKAVPQLVPDLDWQPPEPAFYTPLDLMIVLSVPSTAASAGPSSIGLKLRLLRSSLDFVVNNVGPRARICLVAFTVGDASMGSLRKTPWLATGRQDGLKRLQRAVSELTGEAVSQHGQRSALVSVDPKEERITVASAVNLALDIILQRHTKSATSSMILLNDGRDGAQKAHIELLNTRAEAAKVAIHTFGWGKSHDPSSLWLLSNHTKGSYTFVRDFYQLKESLAGCIGGMLSVAVTALNLHLSVQERRWFRIRKVAGVGNAIVSSDGKDVDITLGELRFGEKKEMLVEIEFGAPRNTANPRSSVVLKRKPSMTATDDFFIKRMGVDPHALSDIQDEFYDEVGDTMADDVPIFEVNAAFCSPHDEHNRVQRLPYPSLLTTVVMPPPKRASSGSSEASASVSEPAIVRRRMELLTSDMLTRALLLMSRRQDAQAQRLLTETVRIFEAIISNLIPSGTAVESIKPDTAYAKSVLSACLEDVEQLKTGCSDRADFDSIFRNFGAQQAVALRDQRAWTSRTATEALFFNREWIAIFGKALSATSF